MSYKPPSLEAIHDRLIGLSSEDQIQLLLTAGVSRNDADELDDRAASLRVGSAHSETPINGGADCDVCGEIPSVGVDLYWHPAAATLLPDDGIDSKGEFIWSCPSCGSFEVESIPTAVTTPGETVCRSCGHAAADDAFKEYRKR